MSSYSIKRDSEFSLLLTRLRNIYKNAERFKWPLDYIVQCRDAEIGKARLPQTYKERARTYCFAFRHLWEDTQKVKAFYNIHGTIRPLNYDALEEWEKEIVRNEDCVESHWTDTDGNAAGLFHA